MCTYCFSSTWLNFQAFVVFILYIRCTSINPADPGIMSKFQNGFRNAPTSGTGLQDTNLPGRGDVATGTNSPTSTFKSSLDGRSNHAGLAAGDGNNLSSQPPRSSSCSLVGGLICALFVEEDCRTLVDSEHQADGEDALFCTLCNAEVSLYMCSTLELHNDFCLSFRQNISFIFLCNNFVKAKTSVVRCC